MIDYVFELTNGEIHCIQGIDLSAAVDILACKLDVTTGELRESVMNRSITISVQVEGVFADESTK